jgi:16S rRNA pseudouridine516 synthase
MNLETLLFSQGFGTRRQCRALIVSGNVLIGEHIVDDPSAQIAPETREFTVDGTTWPYHEKAYLMLHKPAGYECSRDPQHHASVFSLLPAPLVERGVQCVGRLDQDTTGLLLLSDDGRFVHALASPKKSVAKIYEATVRHPLDDAQLGALRAGVLLHGDTAPSVAIAARALAETRLELTIAEGKYHQVKRMVAASGNRVEALHRRAIGSLSLPETLAPGQWCWLTPDQQTLARTAA